MQVGAPQRHNGFLSTPSARRATVRCIHRDAELHQISIHALREEGDAETSVENLGEKVISIHALREEGDVTIQQSASACF